MDFPIENGDFHSFLCLPEGKPTNMANVGPSQLAGVSRNRFALRPGAERLVAPGQLRQLPPEPELQLKNWRRCENPLSKDHF